MIDMAGSTSTTWAALAYVLFLVYVVLRLLRRPSKSPLDFLVAGRRLTLPAFTASLVGFVQIPGGGIAGNTDASSAYAAALIGGIRSNVERALRGKPDVVRRAVETLLAGGHLLLEDVPGVGKTTLAHALARSIDENRHLSRLYVALGDVLLRKDSRYEAFTIYSVASRLDPENHSARRRVYQLKQQKMFLI